MLQEKPKKERAGKDKSAEPTPWRKFWRLQKECWLRMVTPFLMYLFMSLIALALETIDQSANTPLEIVLGSVCIAGGAAFNVHLAYHYGILHYDAYSTGCVRRRNRALGIPTGESHEEKEYRVWKGFYIGFLVGIPTVVMSLLSLAFDTVMSAGLMMFTPWAYLPVRWIGGEGTRSVWCCLMALLPTLVTGISYLVGAHIEKGKLERRQALDEELAALGGKKGKKNK